MGTLEQLKRALTQTVKLTKDPEFRTKLSLEEQEFYKSYIKELQEEIDAEYEALEYIRRRDMKKEHDNE